MVYHFRLKNYYMQTKMIHYMRIVYLFVAVIILFSGCNTEKLDLDKITATEDANTGKINDTVYVKQNPDWTGFNNPQDILVGREPFLYVADTDNDQIVMLNLAGQVLGKRSVKHPIALAQDYLLNLIVCAEFDTVIQGNKETFSAVYKLDLYSVGHHIENAKLERVIPTAKDFLYLNETKRREYTGVCAFYDNSFYVSRIGPNNTSIFDPDNAILIYQKKKSLSGIKVDTLIGTVPLLTPEGTGLLSANKISSLTSFDKKNMDFILTLVGNNSFRTQWLQYVESSEFSGYVSRLSPSNATMMSINKFLQPEDVAIDNSDNIFVADAAKDSIYKFNSYGDELQSFGGPSVFKSPHAVAFFDKTLYVVDSGNNRILRFILSTETD